VTYLDKKTWRSGRIVMGDLPGKKLVRAQRRTRNVVGLENTLPEMVAQRRTRNEVGLGNALPKK
jgi:hypothetical protein